MMPTLVFATYMACMLKPIMMNLMEGNQGQSLLNSNRFHLVWEFRQVIVGMKLSRCLRKAQNGC